MASKTIEAAGGIVVRKGAGRLIAVVQRSKDDAWVLPRGKLKRDENPVAGARREVIEETGHRVEVHEYLGAITYRAGGRPKVVQFWRMEAEPEASHELMADIVAVEWLPLKAAVRRLSYPLEKLFLRHAAARALKKRRVKAGKANPAKSKSSKTKSAKARSGKTKSGKTKLGKIRSAKAKPDKGTSRKHKSKPVKVRSSKRKSAASKTAAKPPRKSKRQAKTAKEKNKAKTGDKKKRKGKPGSGQRNVPAADKQPARILAANEAAAGTVTSKDNVVTALPDRTGAVREAAETSEHRTILQRMLGRLAG